MKILHAFDFFSPQGGGTPEVISQTTRALAQKGHDVSIYASDFALDREYVNAVKGVDVRLFRCWGHLAGFYLMPGLVGEVRRRLREFDIVHLNCQRSFQNIVIHHYAMKYGIPYVLNAHGSTARSFRGRGPKWLLKWLFDVAAGNRLMKDAACLLADTAVGVAEYEAAGADPDKIVLMSLLRDLGEFAELPARGAFRRKYGLEGKRIVLFLGRLHWIKGVDFLTESFYELAKVRDDVVLVIVGPDDGHKSSLEQLVGRLDIVGKVIFTGLLVGREKLSALVDADVLVQTSLYEQAAWAPYEAVMCNTPIIVSSNSGAGEDVRKMDTGYLVEYGNKNSLRDMIQFVLDNTAEAAVKTGKAKEYIQKNLSLETGIDRVISLYADCVRRSRLIAGDNAT